MRTRLANLALLMFKKEFLKAKEENNEYKLKIMTERIIHLYVGLNKDIENSQLEEKTKELKVA